VPRDVEPAVNDLEGVYLYDIDALEAIAAESRTRREQEIVRCRRIIDEQVKTLPIFSPADALPAQHPQTVSPS
jgi:glutamyl-tRNA reductase